MKNRLLAIGVALLLGLSIVNQVQIYKLRDEMQILHVEIKDAYSRLYAQDKPAAHHYRFERSSASLWRYDEATGESCQVTSNQIDKWAGGRSQDQARPETKR
jgi:hypothetical protein